MIRYADDIVVLCRSEAEARKALDLLGKLIAERGLTLHPDKTRLVNVSIPGEALTFSAIISRGYSLASSQEHEEAQGHHSIQNQAQQWPKSEYHY